MASDSKKSRRPRFRFNFSSQSKRAKDVKVTDDILNSLTRQAQPPERPEGEENRGFEEVVETEDANQFQGPDLPPTSQPRIGKNRSFGQLAATLMVLGGFIAVWAYGSVTKAYDLSFLARPILDSGAPVVFANPAQVGVISVAVLLIALWVRRRRRNSSSPGKRVASPSAEL